MGNTSAISKGAVIIVHLDNEIRNCKENLDWIRLD